MLAQENNPNELVNLPELDALTGKDKALRRAFVINYVNDPKRNGTKAAIRAGYSAGEKNASAMVTASRLLRDVKVLAAIKAVEEYFVGPNLKAEIVAKLRAIMRGDITDVMAWDESGNIRLIPSDELSPEAAAAVSQITGFKEEKQGRFDFGDKKDVEMEKVRQQVKMHDPLKAADLLAKIGGFAAPEKMELSGQPLTIVVRETGGNALATANLPENPPVITPGDYKHSQQLPENSEMPKPLAETAPGVARVAIKVSET